MEKIKKACRSSLLGKPFYFCFVLNWNEGILEFYKKNDPKFQMLNF